MSGPTQNQSGGAFSAPPVNMTIFTLVLGVLSAFSPLAIDMYLPALPSMERAFATTPAAVQGSLSAYFIGFGFAQLIYGPLGDRYGRRWPVVVGSALFVLACIACALAPNIQSLIAARFVAGIGACAGPVLARAMVRDTCAQDQASRMLSRLMLVMGVAPLVAPLVGGQLLVQFGWAAIFWVLAGFGAIAILLMLWLLPETLPIERRRRVGVAAMLADYGRLLRSRRYLGYALTGSAMVSALFAYLSGAPFVFINLFGVAPDNFGYIFGLNVIGMMLCAVVNGRLVGRIGGDHMILLAASVVAASGIALAVLGMSGWGGLVALCVPLFLFVSMISVVMPNASVGALVDYPHMAGSASALMGTMQFGLGAVAGVLVGALSDGTARPMTLVMAGCAVVTLLCFVGLVRRA